MQDDTESGKQSKKSRPSKKGLVLVLSCSLLIVLIGGVFWFFFHYNQSPIPKNIRQNVTFPIYYPGRIPNGYKYERNSAKLQNGLFYYAVWGNGKRIGVVEQALPNTPPDPNVLPGFKQIESTAGNAVAGLAMGQPVAIIRSNTTLITITGDKNVPSDALIKLVSSMTSL